MRSRIFCCNLIGPKSNTAYAGSPKPFKIILVQTKQILHLLISFSLTRLLKLLRASRKSKHEVELHPKNKEFHGYKSSKLIMAQMRPDITDLLSVHDLRVKIFQLQMHLKCIKKTFSDISMSTTYLISQ